MKPRLCLLLLGFGCVLASPLPAFPQVHVVSGQAETRPLPASPVNAGLPISGAAQPAPAPSGAIQAGGNELAASLATLQAQLRYTLTVLASHNGQTRSALTGAPAVTAGSNLSSQTATNFSGRMSENLGANLSASPGSPVPQSPPLMSPPTGSAPGVPTAAQSIASTTTSGTPPQSSARLLALQQQMQVLLAQLDEVTADPQLAGTISNPPGTALSAPALAPTGRTPEANRRPQPPRNLRIQ